MDRFLGDFMEDEYITPTYEEVADLYMVVEASPYEFDYNCDDVLNKAKIRGLSVMMVQLKIHGRRMEMVE